MIMALLERRLVYRFITHACQLKAAAGYFLFIDITIMHQKAASTLESPRYCPTLE